MLDITVLGEFLSTSLTAHHSRIKFPWRKHESMKTWGGYRTALEPIVILRYLVLLCILCMMLIRDRVVHFLLFFFSSDWGISRNISPRIISFYSFDGSPNWSINQYCSLSTWQVCWHDGLDCMFCPVECGVCGGGVGWFQWSLLWAGVPWDVAASTRRHSRRHPQLHRLNHQVPLHPKLH